MIKLQAFTRKFRRLARLLKDRSGAAAVEMGLVAPVLVIFLVCIVDLGMALYQWTVVEAAVSAGGQFAFLAGQNGTAAATIQTQTASVVQSASHSLLTASNVTVTVNNGQPATNTCCLTSTGPGQRTWSCAATAPTCSDGSNPGLYIEIVGTYTLKPIIPNVSLTGATLTSDVVARIR